MLKQIIALTAAAAINVSTACIAAEAGADAAKTSEAAGIPSVGSNGHAFRLQRDILMRGPVDLLFIETAVNDVSNFPESYDTYTKWSGHLHLPWPVILGDGLTPGKHTIKVRTTAQAPNRTALHIIQMLLN